MNGNNIHLLNPVPLTLPLDEIYSRLGRNRHLAADPRPEKIESMIRRGFELLHPCGAWTYRAIGGVDAESVRFDGKISLDGADAVRRLDGCCGAIFMAATVGGGISEAAFAAVEAGDGALALVLDAVGGECADAALDWVEKNALQTLRRSGLLRAGYRFSAGYGDLDLSCQKIWFELLPLNEWGVTLTPGGIMCPEKSVTAVMGVKYGL